MSAMRDYVTPQERVLIQKNFNIRKQFVIDELKDIHERRHKLENILRIINEKHKD